MADNDEPVIIHVLRTPEPCDHEWSDDDDPNVTYCLKCGMSFWRYAFIECI